MLLAVSVMLPLVVAYLLVGQLGKTAHANVAASDASLRVASMEKGHAPLSRSRRHDEAALHGEVAERLAKRGSRRTLIPWRLRAIIELTARPGCARSRSLGANSTMIAQATKPPTGPDWRDRWWIRCCAPMVRRCV
ncbi:MAG: hypothetical protein IPQ07_12765 [Myxococcales bacterium]|nr:hypothetical protein [Myxococcales bacterium]